MSCALGRIFFARRPAMLGLMGFSAGRLPLYVIIDIIFVY